MGDVKVMDMQTEAQTISSSLRGQSQDDGVFSEAKEDDSEGDDSVLMQTRSDSGDNEACVVKEPLTLRLNNPHMVSDEMSVVEPKFLAKETMNGDGDHVKSENGESKPEMKASTSLGALNDVGNKIKTELSSSFIATPKKSNLKRRIEGTPDSAKGKCTKRIRIVENLEAVNRNNFIKLGNQFDACKDIFPGADDSAEVKEMEACGETIVWLNSSSTYVDLSAINVEYVRANLSPVKRNFSVEVDMRFVLTETVTSILALKSQVSNLGPSDFHLWIAQNSFHRHSNLKCEYEENFIKMANLDALVSYDLTSPKELTLAGPHKEALESIYFIGDLYQSCKGFREYLLWRTSQHHEYFSTKILSLQSLGPCCTENEVNKKTGLLFHASNKLKNLIHLPTQTVEEFRSQPSNILDVSVINQFVSFVHLRTNGNGLHLFVADNSAVSNIYESCREIRFQKQFYVQCLLALSCVREGGTFICKIFDTITLFTNGLLFLMYKCFKSITIHKPSSSSTFTAERFLICKGKIDNPDSKYVLDFLCDCLDMVVNNQEQRKIVRRKVRKRLAVLKMEVQALVPLKVILSHAEFFQFMRSNNMRLCSQLVQSMQNLCLLLENKDKNQLNELANRLKAEKASKLSQWNLSLERLPYSEFQDIFDPIEQCSKFLSKHAVETQSPIPKALPQENINTILKQEFSNADDGFIFVFPFQGNLEKGVFCSKHGLFFASGQGQLLHLNKVSNSWELINNLPKISLPFGTMILGELAEEIHQKKYIHCLHVFDVIFLNSVYIGVHKFEDRRRIFGRFLCTIRNPTDKVNEHVSMTSSIGLMKIPNFLQRSERRNFMGYKDPNLRCYPLNNEITDNSWALFRGFQILKAVDDKIPATLFKNYQQYIWFWNEDVTNFKTD